jgi:hypothetical protein
MTEKEKIKHFEKITGNKYYPNVETLDNSGCTGLKELPALPNVKYLYNSGCTGLKELPEKLYLSKSIGSRYDITEYWIKSDEIKCGCFSGNLKDFKKRVLEVYPDKKNIHRINYIIFIEECENFKK